MNELRRSLEVIAPSIEEAVEKGLIELGVPDDAVDVEVLDSGSKGLFGLGSRQARIRLTVKEEATSSPEWLEKPVSSAQMDVQVENNIPRTKSSQATSSLNMHEELDLGAEDLVEPKDELALRVGREIVMELLELMKIDARVVSYYAEPDDAHSKSPVWVDVRGKDLSVLIGPHAETLNALQSIVALMVNKELGHSVSLVVDVEGYRVRRMQEVRRLARRMADQAIKTGRRQILEPMPASERRLVHIELRNNPGVTTESVGEEPRRKVTINPK